MRTTPTFQEIGAELGISEKDASNAYYSGMRKLRSTHPGALEFMDTLRHELERARRTRLICGKDH